MRQRALVLLTSLLSLTACAAATGEAELGRADPAGKGDVSSTQRAALFDEGRIWSKYRKLHDKIDGAKSLRSLESLSDKAADLAIDLEQALPEDPLAADLALILDSGIAAQEEILDRPRGREPRTDFAAKLRTAIPRTAAYARVAERLLEAGVEDPWVVQNLYAGLVSSIAGTSWLASRVRADLDEGELEATDELRELLAEAEAGLDRARSVEKRLPAEARAAAEG